MRYYTQNNIGIAKNIVDVASTCIMVRDMFEDEYTGSESKKEIKAYRLEGENKRICTLRDSAFMVSFIATIFCCISVHELLVTFPASNLNVSRMKYLTPIDAYFRISLIALLVLYCVKGITVIV